MLRLQPCRVSAKQQVPGPPFQLSSAKENQGEVFDMRPSSETVPPMPYLASWELLTILILPNAKQTNKQIKQSPAQEATHTLRNLDHRNSPECTCKTHGASELQGEVLIKHKERTAANVYQKHFEIYPSNNQILV